MKQTILRQLSRVYNGYCRRKRMTSGHVVGIFIAPSGRAPLTSQQSIVAVPARGLKGDRYFNGTGTFSKAGKLPQSQEVSLIESEAIEAVQREESITLEPGASRRNIITRDVALNHLVDQEFHVGEVRMKGIKLCEPCGHLEGLTQEGVKKALIHRGGLRAQILTQGTIHVGDPIAIEAPKRSAACV
jgi:MOSC domain-containing protein YiiM